MVWLEKMGVSGSKLSCSRTNEMARKRVSDQEWQMFLDIADRLGINVRGQEQQAVTFTEMEAAGHAFGRAVAQESVERMAFSKSRRLTGPQACPGCGCHCSVTYRKRDLTTVDGDIDLDEPVCHCSKCRRDFFPSAS
jgi:hypothetical protein